VTEPVNSKPDERERSAIQFKRFVADAAGCQIQPGRLTLTFRRAASGSASPDFNSGCASACHRTYGPKVFPSLGAHEPNPAGRSSIRTRRPITLHFLPYRLRNLTRSVRVKLVSCAASKLDGDAQFTNRRMRTFIATPSARNANNTEDPP
jgi:hypothetical protein